MRYFITGARGQLGATLVDMLPENSVFATNLPEYDVGDIEAMRNVFDSWSVDVVIHCAAYTNVEGCALNPEIANLVNAIGTKNMAHLCAEYGAAMVLLSTNEVFDGSKLYSYTEQDLPGAINPYGESKLAAERYMLDILERYYIVRTSWMYAAGGANFVHTILNLANQGASFINYTAHGYESGWADPSFDNNNVNQMTNSGKYPTMVGNCCLTNAFDSGSCFGETLLRKKKSIYQ